MGPNTHSQGLSTIMKTSFLAFALLALLATSALARQTAKNGYSMTFDVPKDTWEYVDLSLAAGEFLNDTDTSGYKVMIATDIPSFSPPSCGSALMTLTRPMPLVRLIRAPPVWAVVTALARVPPRALATTFSRSTPPATAATTSPSSSRCTWSTPATPSSRS